jgi:hypothetical protein
MTARRVNDGAPGGDAARAADELAELNRHLAELEARSGRAFSALSRDANAAAADVRRLNREIEAGMADALAGLLSDTRKTRRALQDIWEGFLSFFARRIVAGMKGALTGAVPSPGGVFGSVVGGILSLFGLQEGGFVRGSAAGTPVLVGENFTDELIVPLKKLGLSAPEVAGVAGPAAAVAPPAVNVYPQFVIENRTPLEADLAVYRLAESGRVRAAARRLNAAPDVER